MFLSISKINLFIINGNVTDTLKIPSVKQRYLENQLKPERYSKNI